MREKNLHLDGRAVCLQVLQSRKQPLRRVWIGKMSSFPRLELQKTPKSTPGAAVLYIRGARVRWRRRRKRRETRKFSGLDSLGGASVASKSDRYPVFVRFCRATYAALSHPAWRSHPERANLAVSGGGAKSAFLVFLGSRKNPGSSPSQGGQTMCIKY